MFPLWANVLSGLGAFFIVFENVVVISLVLCKRHLRTYTNGFIVSLATSDFLLGAVFVPAYLANPGDSANGYLIGILLYTNVANICAVTAERYIAILKPFSYEVTMLKHFVKILVMSWTFPIVISLLPLCWGNVGVDEDTIVHKVYLGFLLIACTLLPCIFLVVTYSLIFSEVLRQMKGIKRNNTSSYDRDNKRHVVREGKVALIFAAVTVIFIAAWGPTLYMTFTASLLQRTDLIPEHLWIVSFILILISSASNAIIYAFCKKDFRYAILTALNLKKRRENYANSVAFSKA